MVDLAPGPACTGFGWDLHYEPIAVEDIEDAGDEDATGAVPHHTHPAVNAPWAPPGRYTVRLTVGGTTVTQPLTLRLDPRVHTPAAGLRQLADLSREMYDGARAAHAAYQRARGLLAQIDDQGGAELDAFKRELEAVAPAPPPRPRFFRRRGPAGPPTLSGASEAMMSAAMAMQGADLTPTAGQVAACRRAQADGDAVMGRWKALSTTGLEAVNAKRRGAGKPALTLPR